MNRGLALFLLSNSGLAHRGLPLSRKPTWASALLGWSPAAKGYAGATVRRRSHPTLLHHRLYSVERLPSLTAQVRPRPWSPPARERRAPLFEHAGRATGALGIHSPLQFLLAAAGFVSLPSPVPPRPMRRFLQFVAVVPRF